MRRSSAHVARILTIVSLLSLITLSFVVLLQNNPQAATSSLLKRDRIFVRAASTSDSSSASSTDTSTTSTTVDVSPSSPSSSPTSSSTSATSTTSSFFTSSSTPRQTQSTTSATSTQTTTTSDLTSSTASSSTISSTSTSTASTSITSSNTPSPLSTHSSAHSTNTGISTITSSQSQTLFTQTGIFHLTSTSSDPAPSETDSNVTGAASSSKSFFQNTGAVVGTFLTLGIVLVGLVVGLVIWRRRRRNADRDIFEDEFRGGRAQGYGDGDDFSTHNMSETYMEPLSHAPAHAYPDRGTHYGNVAPRITYETPQTADYTLEYPPAIGGAANRDSTASNHAGFGAYGTSHVNEQEAPMHQQVTFDNSYTEPAIAEEQSMYMVPMSDVNDGSHDQQASFSHAV